jgi:hypothetical protein
MTLYAVPVGDGDLHLRAARRSARQAAGRSRVTATIGTGTSPHRRQVKSSLL